ncbi:MAG: hypothetical protein ACYSWX_14055 [Planctomycetota bacterium]
MDEAGTDERRPLSTGTPESQRHMHHGLHRPPWKRIVLPLVGLTLFVAGTFLWLLPAVPGGFLAYIGIPLMFAVSPRHEVLMRRWVNWRVRRTRVRLRRWWRRRRQRDGRT